MPGAENFPELRPVALPSQATVCFLSIKYWWLKVIQENSASGGGGLCVDVQEGGSEEMLLTAVTSSRQCSGAETRVAS